MQVETSEHEKGDEHEQAGNLELQQRTHQTVYLEPDPVPHPTVPPNLQLPIISSELTTTVNFNNATPSLRLVSVQEGERQYGSTTSSTGFGLRAHG